MTEFESRNYYVDTMRGWIGAKEGDAIHKRIIDTYNSLKPLPRNYSVTYKDSWCAATVSAAAIEAGLTDIIPRECSCAKMIERFKDMKRWMEDDGYIPQPGDIILYDWNDSGKGDCTGNPEHVGVVEKVADGVITVIEGNYHDAVGRRNIPVNGRYIRGYGLPDYASMSDSPPPVTVSAPDAATPPPPSNVSAPDANAATPVTIVAPLTNGGRIRAMTNEELADFLCHPPVIKGTVLDWLNAPAQ